MIFSNIFTRPASQHSLAPDYLNEPMPIAIGLELLNYALSEQKYQDPKRKDCRLVNLSKLPPEQASAILRTLCFSMAPLLFKGIKSYAQFASAKGSAVSANICNENIISRKLLADKVKVLQESAKALVEQTGKGTITVKIFPRRIIHVLGNIIEIVEAERILPIKPDDYPVLITFSGITTEQYQELKKGYAFLQ